MFGSHAGSHIISLVCDFVRFAPASLYLQGRRCAGARLIDGGMATEAVMAHVVVGRFCDSHPLYR
jgi:hypothetical protein